MKKKPHYDAIIVGARAAGAATAMLLAQRGLNVLAVDRARYGSDTLSTHALMRAGVVQLHRWGLLDRIREAGTPPISEVTFRYPDEVVPVTITPSDGVDALFAPRRTVLDSILVDAARESGAEFRFGVVVDDLTRDATGAVHGIVARDQHGQTLELDADLVIGADGVRSIVAQNVGASNLVLASNSGAVVYAYFDNVEAAGYEWGYGPGVSAGVIPTNNGQVCVFVGGSEAYFRRHVFRDLPRGFTEVLWKTSPDIAERVANGTQMERYRGFAGIHGYIRQSSGPGWALVGDAGHFRDPITTHGISDALRDAELLARAVAGSSTMAEYEGLRNSVIADLFTVTNAIAGYDWTMEELRGHLREVSRASRAEMHLIREFDEAEAA